jgi:uncharacterized DUF497 family protein
MRYRLRLRGFDLETVEHIVRHSPERYVDAVTGRLVAVGRHAERLIVVPYEVRGDILTPVTVHVTSRQQVNFRVRSGRYANE